MVVGSIMLVGVLTCCALCNIGPKYCALKKEVRRKEILKLEGKGRKYSSHLLFT